MSIDSAGDPSGSGYTDSDGAFTVGGLPGGDYRVWFYDCGLGTFLDEYYDNQTDLDSADPVAVIAGADTPGINAALSSLGSNPPDTTPPDTVIDAGPTGTISTSQTTFSFRGDPTGDTAKIQCRIDSEPFTDCSSPKMFSGLADGEHTAVFRAEDAAGNQDPTPATRTFTVDTTTPPDDLIYRAKISKVKVKGPAKVKRGKKATYKVKISNAGDAEATGVKLQVKGKGVKAKKNAGTIPAGASKTVKVKLKFKKPGKVKTTFKVTSSNAGGKTVKKKIKVKK